MFRLLLPAVATAVVIIAAPGRAVQAADTCALATLSSLYRTHCAGPVNTCGPRARFESFRQWLIERNKPCTTVVADLTRRFEILSDTATHAIDTTGIQWAGDAGAPVRIVMYVSMSCPLCKHLYAQLHDTVTVGSLKGVARIGIRFFGTSPLDRIAASTTRWGKQPEFMLALRSVTQRLTANQMFAVADSIGIPVKPLRILAESDASASIVTASRREAERNGIRVTPAFFINMRAYRSYKDAIWVADAARYMSGR